MRLETLRFERDGRAARVTLDRPQAMNAITMRMLDELQAVCDRVERDEDIRALVVTGSGEAFSVGADIELLARAFGDHAEFRRFLEQVNRTLLRVEALPVPVIAAVNGLARAGGFELLLACDLVVVAEEARIADHHLHFGVIPGGGATQRAPRKLGEQRARELIFTARWLSGAEAAAYGIALRAVPLARLDQAVDELLDGLVDKPRSALAAAKRAMAGGRDLPIARAVQLEVEELLHHVATSRDPTEGFRAYRERRTPSWRDGGPA